MKKFLLLMLVIGVFGIAIYIAKDNSKPRLDIPRPDDTSEFKPDPSNATFVFFDGPVTLTQGKIEQKISPESELMEEVAILENRAYDDINADGKDDVAIFLTRSGVGSGNFIYIASFVSGPVSYKGSNAVYLGDRIIPQDISIKNGVVTAKYLDRGPDEGFAAEPTIPASKQFVFRNGVLEER